MPSSKQGYATVPGVGTVAFTWDRIAQLIDAFGVEFDTKISTAARNSDVATLAAIVAIGNGDMTADEVMQASPPIQPTTEALITALNYAFHGTAGAPQLADENPTIAARLLTSLVRRFR